MELVEPEYEAETLEEAPAPAEPERNWLEIAKHALESSTNYMDANWRKRWEENIALFRSEHPPGSKYHSDAYKHRSRIFRPKTRSVVRKNEAAAAAAYFSNVDVISSEAENENDNRQLASAELMQQVLGYRLQKSVPWFKVVMGAFQECQVIGVAAAHLYWKYISRDVQVEQPALDDLGQPLMDAAGQPIIVPQMREEVIEDKPCVELLPIENIRFDAGADWLDPVNSSPYFIVCWPMYVHDVKQMMKRQDRKTGQPTWKTLSDEEIRAAKIDYDTMRQAREGVRQDPKVDNEAPLGDFDIVWCHENFIRLDGEDHVFWTLGKLHMLTDPVPIKQVYLTGERPVVIGTTMIEAHKAIPDSPVQIGANLQREANDVVNTRMDNVKLVLNKRWLVKRGANVDTGSLLRNVAGGITMADSVVETDIRPVEFTDVTSSAYAEQDRINVDYDELLGNFSAGSVQTNRQLNETVGGMQMLRGASGQLTEYTLMTFTETFMEPVLRMLVKLEQAYETDLTILSLAAEKAQLFQRYGIDQVTDDLLNQSLTIRVNVGMGATDPNTKLLKFRTAAETYAGVRNTIPDSDPEALQKEIFGLAGYRNGQRFFLRPDDPELANKGMVPMQQLNDIKAAASEEVAKRDDQIQKLTTENRKKEIVLAEKDLKLLEKDMRLGITQMTVQATNEVQTKGQAMAKEGEQRETAKAAPSISINGTDPQVAEGIAAIGQMAQQIQQGQEAQLQALQTIAQQNQQVLQALQGLMQAAMTPMDVQLPNGKTIRGSRTLQ